MNKYFKISAFALVLAGFIACESDDKTVDLVTSETQRGAILRQVSLLSNELPLGNPDGDAEFRVILEEQDYQDGDLLDQVEVYVGFRDNTVADGAMDMDVAEALFTTLSPADFFEGPFGLPRTEFVLTYDELLSFTGVSGDNLDGGDQFTVRFELVLTDGRRYSNDTNSNTITGSFLASPFLYTPSIICPSDLNVEFDWVATDFFFQGASLGDLGSPSGTDSLVRQENSATTYTYASGFFDFGYYCVVYNGADPGCGDGAAGTLFLSDVCGDLTYGGTDQFGDAWEISDVSVSGSDLTFTWLSAYGEQSTVTLTRTDGEDWSALIGS
ncbi:hypothetical protein [Croceiramulus getboli]|nr:hypothetical protein P8624_07380 [Flavobacteriaceae bacterium YJPT1-3]